MRIAYFDPFSGASGDMILGALLDAGLSLPALQSELSKLGLTGYQIDVAAAVHNGITGSRFTVIVGQDQPSRDWTAIDALIAGSGLAGHVKAAARDVFRRLAGAEAKVHGVAPDHVHFHEVGGVDAIIDICGAVIGFDLLGIEQIYCGPLRLGSGFVQSQHGLLPVPATATTELLAASRAPTRGPTRGLHVWEAELLTPTGAAILTTLAEFQRPDFAPTAIGYGFGQRELPWPNALRVWLAEIADQDGENGGEIVIETNIDDMNPQFYALLSDRLFAAGALDVWLTPITMKKGRPATQLNLICSASEREQVIDILMMNSTTLGVRLYQIERVKAARQHVTVTTRWGNVRLKLRGWTGRIVEAMPEYDDCLVLAREHNVPLREVWDEAHRLGDVFVGRRVVDLPGQ